MLPSPSLPPSIHDHFILQSSLDPPSLPPPPPSSPLQIIVASTARVIIFSNDLLRDVKEFKVTVETIDWLIPSVKSRLDSFFEDAISFAKAYQGM